MDLVYADHGRRSPHRSVRTAPANRHHLARVDIADTSTVLHDSTAVFPIAAEITDRTVVLDLGA
ncbi:hypothetical protein [Nocardia sp. NPDC005745]|uniref:hypothetical protein n=1 Tax=Nocardia sp. NPDC005745 TaxID=3157061 RepID=UPI0033C81F46